MFIKISWKSESEIPALLAEQEALGNTLKEIQNHFDGNFLIFEKPVRDLAAELDTLKAGYDALKARIEKLEGG